nr:pectin acetylesterase 8-like [Ipomoea batatas]
MMDELLSKGMKQAKNAILAGSSAGGVATIIHCDRFRSHLPKDARVKCLSDSAFFLHDRESLQGEKRFDRIFEGLVGFQVYHFI